MLDASYPIALSPPVDLPVNPPLYSIRTRQEIQFLQLLTILQLNQRVKHCTYHKRAGLPCSKNSDWTVLYAAKDNDQFIHMMGIDVASFEHLVKAIDQYLAAVQNNNNYNNRNRNNRINSNNNNDSEEFMESKYQDYNNEADPQVVGQTKGNESEAKEAGGVIRRKKNQSHHNQARVIHRRKKNKGGRPSGLDSKGKLALLLYYLHQPVQQKALAVTFGILESTCSITLSQMLPLFEQVLMREADASIRWPTRSEMKEFAEQIAYVHPNLPDPVWGLSLIHISEPTRLGMISYAV